jgi:hypothetical protein
VAWEASNLKVMVKPSKEAETYDNLPLAVTFQIPNRRTVGLRAGLTNRERRLSLQGGAIGDPKRRRRCKSETAASPRVRHCWLASNECDYAYLSLRGQRHEMGCFDV